MKTNSPERANDDWVAAVRAFVAVAQRAAIVPEPTPPMPPPVRPPGVPPVIDDPSPPAPPPREPTTPPPVSDRRQ